MNATPDVLWEIAWRFASLSLLERDYSRADLAAIRKPLDFPERHGFDISGLKSTLAKMSGMRVLVIGTDSIVPGTSSRRCDLSFA